MDLMMTRLFVLLPTLFLLLSASTTFCHSAGNVLRIATKGQPASLDPQKIGGTWERDVVSGMFVGLITENAKAEPVPGVAESWTISPDGKTYTFTLRESFWSDGTPLTAEDFVYSFRRILHHPSSGQYSSLLYIIEGAEEVNTGKAVQEALQVTALDEKTLQIQLTGPAPYFIELLTHYSTYPVPRQVIERLGDDWSRPENIVSNGPYRVVQWIPHSSITMVRNRNFYDNDKVFFDTIIFDTLGDQQVAQKKFEAHQLDIVLDFASNSLPWLKNNMPNEIRVSPYMSTFYYTFNTQKKPFTDKRLRTALAMVINREAIVNIVLKTGEIPAYSLIPPGVAHYTTPKEVGWKKFPYRKRIERARKLLEEAGFGQKNPLYLNLTVNDTFNNRRICRAVASMWNLIGVQTALLYTDINTHYTRLEEGNFEIAKAAWNADYNDAQNFLYLMESRTGKHNYGRYSNKEFDRLMKLAQKTTDLSQRAEILYQAESIAIDDMPNIPVFHYVSKNLIAQDIKGFIDNPKNVHHWRYISRKP